MLDRIRDIIHVALAERGITRYRLTDLTSENWQLPGSSYYREIEAESGIVVTPEHAYHFELGWADDHYTLGEEGKGWHELMTPDDTTEHNWQKTIQLQHKMYNDPKFGWLEPLSPLIRELGKPTKREVTIIWWWLASSRFFATRDLTDYAEPIFEAFEVLDVQSGGHDLVGSLLPGEVQDISGILVLAQGAFHFHLSWKPWESVDDPHPNDREYSLGAKDGSLRPMLHEECSEEQWQQIQMMQQRLKQVFARLPRSEQTRSHDLTEDDAQPTELRHRLSQTRRERRLRIPHNQNKNEITKG